MANEAVPPPKGFHVLHTVALGKCDVTALKRVDGMGEPHPEGSYIRIIIDPGNVDGPVYKADISEGAASALADQLSDLAIHSLKSQSPSPAVGGSVPMTISRPDSYGNYPDDVWKLACSASWPSRQRSRIEAVADAIMKDRRERRKHEHVLVKCSDGHNNWMERGEAESWCMQTAYCATCGKPLYEAGVQK